MLNKDYLKELTDQIISKKLDKDKISRLKLKLCKKYKMAKIPTDIEILLNANPRLLHKLRALQSKPTRTMSGVAVIAIMTQPHKCPHGKCAMCPGGINSEFGSVPQSYTGKEPATRRAIRNDYDPYLQVMNRLEQYIAGGHNPEKVELIVMGGTFPALPKKYKDEFITYAYKAMNDFSRLFYAKGILNVKKFRDYFELPVDINNKDRETRIKQKLLLQKNIKFKNLSTEQDFNETGDIRCVGLTIETRPDHGRLSEGNDLLRLGCTRIELGIQSVYDSALKSIERGHIVKDSIDSIRTLKDLGFKLNFHMMPGLPGVSRKDDLAGLKQLFLDQNFQPDMLKIYPCMVLKGTKLYDLWKKKKFKPITTSEAALLIAKFKKYVPQYCRIMRVQRDIPTMMTEAGVSVTNLRQEIDKILLKQKILCNCIRCREIGRNLSQIKIKPKIKIIHYPASGGNEFFIQAVSGRALLGFARLRVPNESLRKEITPDSALLRELHVYGEVIGLGADDNKDSAQHKGIGKLLLNHSESMAKTYNRNKIVVISAIGTREYYKKQGYHKEGPYMVKKLI